MFVQPKLESVKIVKLITCLFQTLDNFLLPKYTFDVERSNRQCIALQNHGNLYKLEWVLYMYQPRKLAAKHTKTARGKFGRNAVLCWMTAMTSPLIDRGNISPLGEIVDEASSHVFSTRQQVWNSLFTAKFGSLSLPPIC